MLSSYYMEVGWDPLMDAGDWNRDLVLSGTNPCQPGCQAVCICDGGAPVVVLVQQLQEAIQLRVSLGAVF